MAVKATEGCQYLACFSFMSSIELMQAEQVERSYDLRLYCTRQGPRPAHSLLSPLDRSLPDMDSLSSFMRSAGIVVAAWGQPHAQPCIKGKPFL